MTSTGRLPMRWSQWCQSNNIKVWGHTLAWHAQTADGSFQGTNGQPVTRELAMERLSNHIMASRPLQRARLWVGCGQ
jgi:GH35 family endo-1,4-beta-xylanase